MSDQKKVEGDQFNWATFEFAALLNPATLYDFGKTAAACYDWYKKSK